MRRFLTLVSLLCFAIPAGITITGCTRNPGENYCNGLGYGQKIDDVYSIVLSPTTSGISMAWGQTKNVSLPIAYTCKHEKATVAGFIYGTSNNQLVDVSPSGELCAGTWNRNTGGGIADYTICTAPNPLPTTDGLPYKSAFITASASAVTSNAVEVHVHAPVTKLALVGPDECLSQGVEWGTALDIQACYTSGGTKYLLCAPASVTQSTTASLACPLPSVNGTQVSRSSIPTCPAAIGTLTYNVANTTVATVNTENNKITAGKPGTTAITTSIAGSGSTAGYFSTCPPKSISLSLADGSNSGTITKGVSQSLTTVVKDTNGNTITGLTLDYQSTDPIDVSASSSGTLMANYPGQATINAVCQPANCNPSPTDMVGKYGTGLPISSGAVSVKVPGTANEYLWFGAPGQSQYFVPMETRTGTLGTPARLPYVPNSMVMDRTGTSLYFGSAYELMIYSTNGNALTKQDSSVPGVVLAVSPTNTELLINDRVRKVIYLYEIGSSANSIENSFGGVAYAAQWTPDAKTLYVVGEGVNLAGKTVPMLFVYNANTSWAKYDLSGTGAVTNLAITVPGVGAYLSGSTTNAFAWCPSGPVADTQDTTFYPLSDSVATQTDVLAALLDVDALKDTDLAKRNRNHILGATVASGGVTLSDINMTIPSDSSTGLPIPCQRVTKTVSGVTTEVMQPMTIEHTLNTVNLTGISATAVNQIVPSPDASMAFITYTGTATGAQLPYYIPSGTEGVAGTVNYLTLTNGSEITAPLAGAFSPDNKYFFVSTAGDNRVHTISITTANSVPKLTDSSQIDVKLPTCTAGGTDSGCTYSGKDSTVAPTVITVKPRETT
jgi:hypothetical protein